MNRFTPATKREVPYCTECMGTEVCCDATARWDADAQDWALSGTCDDTYCDDCGGECSIAWREVQS